VAFAHVQPTIQGWAQEPTLAWGNRPENQKVVVGNEAPPFQLEDRGHFTKSYYQRYIKQHPAEVAQEHYQAVFPKVHIIPQHRLGGPNSPGVDPLLEHFFCAAITNAPHTCRRVREGEMNFPGGTNPSETFDADIFAVAVHEKGLVQEGSKRLAVRSAIHQQFAQIRTRNAMYELPLQCLPPSTLAPLEDLSIVLEKRLFKDTWTPAQEMDLRKGFASTVAKKTFCSVDVEKALQEPEWQTFFQAPRLFT